MEMSLSSKRGLVSAKKLNHSNFITKSMDNSTFSKNYSNQKNFYKKLRYFMRGIFIKTSKDCKLKKNTEENKKIKLDRHLRNCDLLAAFISVLNAILSYWEV